MRPMLLTAAQNVAVGQEIEMTLFVPLTSFELQASLPPVGFVDVIT